MRKYDRWRAMTHLVATMFIWTCSEAPEPDLTTSGPIALEKAPMSCALRDTVPVIYSGFPGVVISPSARDIFARADGEVSAVKVRLGDRVRRGEPLLVISSLGLEKELQQAHEALGQSRGEERVLTNRIAQAEVALARIIALNEAGMVSHAEVENSRSELAGLAIQLQNAVSHSASLTRRVRLATEAVKTTDVRAPIDGVLSVVGVVVGSRVDASTLLVRVVGDSLLQVRFAAPLGIEARLGPGTPVVIVSLDSKRTYRATVSGRSPEVNRPSGSLFVEARLELADEHPTPGETVRVMLHSDPAEVAGSPAHSSWR